MEKMPEIRLGQSDIIVYESCLWKHEVKLLCSANDPMILIVTDTQASNELQSSKSRNIPYIYLNKDTLWGLMTFHPCSTMRYNVVSAFDMLKIASVLIY